MDFYDLCVTGHGQIHLYNQHIYFCFNSFGGATVDPNPFLVAVAWPTLGRRIMEAIAKAGHLLTPDETGWEAECHTAQLPDEWVQHNAYRPRLNSDCNGNWPGEDSRPPGSTGRRLECPGLGE